MLLKRMMRKNKIPKIINYKQPPYKLKLKIKLYKLIKIIDNQLKISKLLRNKLHRFKNQFKKNIFHHIKIFNIL